jgi:hypothetical protein
MGQDGGGSPFIKIQEKNLSVCFLNVIGGTSAFWGAMTFQELLESENTGT